MWKMFSAACLANRHDIYRSHSEFLSAVMGCCMVSDGVIEWFSNIVTSRIFAFLIFQHLLSFSKFFQPQELGNIQ